MNFRLPLAQPLVLAAGTGSRFGGGGQKLTAELAGRPLTEHLFRTLEAASQRRLVAPALVVLRPEDQALAVLAARHGLDVVRVASQALSVTLSAGVRARPGAAAWLMLLADQPFSTASHWRRLIAAWQGGARAVFSDGGNGPQPPALFAQELRAELLSLTGDRGAGQLIGRLRPPPEVVRFPPGIWMKDVDTAADLLDLEREVRARRPPRRRGQGGASGRGPGSGGS